WVDSDNSRGNRFVAGLLGTLTDFFCMQVLHTDKYLFGDRITKSIAEVWSEGNKYATSLARKTEILEIGATSEPHAASSSNLRDEASVKRERAPASLMGSHLHPRNFEVSEERSIKVKM
ncbi:hypothetical protein AVEN_198739-1, partial [Araneus ventricosus]